MIEWMKQDPLFSKIAGAQKAVAPGTQLKRSLYVLTLERDKAYFLFNIFTRQFVQLSNDEWLTFNSNDGHLKYPHASEKDNFAQEEALYYLYAGYYLVPAWTDEEKNYLSYHKLAQMMTREPDGFSHYTILPTSACNARCTYCFEEGWKTLTMSDEMCDAVAAYITRTRCTGPIDITWFGGEPTVAADKIDRICDKLMGNGVQYKSTIVTNGSLITASMADWMKEQWHLTQAQITLDGMPQEYDRRKNYYDQTSSKFPEVIRGIHELLDRGLQVLIRLNADEDNLDSLWELVHLLQNEFPDKSHIGMQPALLHQLQADPDAGYMWDRLSDLIDECRRCGFWTAMETPSSLRTKMCLRENWEHAVVIDPVGRLSKCQNNTDAEKYGTIFSDDITNADAWAEITGSSHIRDKCEGCMFLPECTDYDRCPKIQNTCKKMQQVMLSSWLRCIIDNRQRSNRSGVDTRCD